MAGIEGLEGQLIPQGLIIQEYFEAEQTAIDELKSDLNNVVSEMEEMREENGGEDGLLSDAMNDKGNISKATLKSRIKEIGKRNSENAEEFDLLKKYEKLMAKETKIKTEMDAISHRLTERIKKLAERYETPMPKLTNDVADLTNKVKKHLEKMGYAW